MENLFVSHYKANKSTLSLPTQWKKILPRDSDTWLWRDENIVPLSEQALVDRENLRVTQQAEAWEARRKVREVQRIRRNTHRKNHIYLLVIKLLTNKHL